MMPLSAFITPTPPSLEHSSSLNWMLYYCTLILLYYILRNSLTFVSIISWGKRHPKNAFSNIVQPKGGASSPLVFFHLSYQILETPLR